MAAPSFANWAAGGYANAPLPRLADPASLHSLAGSTMGTSWSLRFDNPQMIPLEQVRATVEAALARIVAQMSTWVEDSDIHRFNHSQAGCRHTLAPEFARVLECALHWAARSDGAIDPTVGPLVALWGFGAQGDAAALPPPRDAIEATRRRVGWSRIEFEPAGRTAVQPGAVWLDFSGVAKGFAVDHAADGLKALGLSNFLLEIGGELKAVGHRPGGRHWQVLVETRLNAGPRVELGGMAIATSGDRWQFRTHGDRRWSHTIDPRTGEPVSSAIASVTVLHPECMHADAIATMLTVLGPDEGWDFAERHRIAALFVCRRDGLLPDIRTTTTWVASSGAA